MSQWVFGYGSLIWRPGFEFLESQFTTLYGWSRSFSQASPDHRGTPNFPGRVLTLREEPGAQCRGRVYRIADERWSEVFRYLEDRESGGYCACRLDLDVGGRTTKAWVWIALPDNPHSVSNESVKSTVEVMLRAKGQSGPNIDYVLNLEGALEEAGITDVEVARYATLLRRHVSESSRD